MDFTLDSIGQYFKGRFDGNYFARKNTTPPASATACGGAGPDIEGILRSDAGSPTPQGPAPDGSVLNTDTGLACYNDGQICEYPTKPNDGGPVNPIQLPPSVTEPVTDADGNELRFSDAFPGARLSARYIGSNLGNIAVLKTCVALDSTQLGPEDSVDPINYPVPVHFGGYPISYIINLAPANAWTSCQADPSNPADPFNVYEDVANGVKFENLKHCPWNTDWQLPAYVMKHDLTCYDENNNVLAILPTEAEVVHVTADAPFGFPLTVPANNGFIDETDPNNFCVIWPHPCYHSDSGRDGSLIGDLDVYLGTDNRQSNGVDPYKTYWWGVSFGRDQ